MNKLDYVMRICIQSISVGQNPGSKNYWSDIEVTSTKYNLNIAPMCFAAWETSSRKLMRSRVLTYSEKDCKC